MDFPKPIAGSYLRVGDRGSRNGPINGNHKGSGGNWKIPDVIENKVLNLAFSVTPIQKNDTKAIKIHQRVFRKPRVKEKEKVARVMHNKLHLAPK